MTRKLLTRKHVLMVDIYEELCPDFKKYWFPIEKKINYDKTTRANEDSIFSNLINDDQNEEKSDGKSNLKEERNTDFFDQSSDHVNPMVNTDDFDDFDMESFLDEP